MKKVIIVIASLAVIGAGFAFSNAGVITHKTEGESTSVSATVTVSETQTETTAAKKSKKEKLTESQSETTAQKETATENKAETTTQKAEQKQSKKSKKKTKKAKHKKKKESPTAATTTESDSLTCTITIECKDIYNHLDDLREEYKPYLPKDGYILNSYTYTFEEGDSVYDVLMSAANEKGISVSTRETVYGIYVSGINHIEEKAVGGTSGWTYYVNGSFPLKSMNKYKVQKGDNILIHYSCVYKK